MKQRTQLNAEQRDTLRQRLGEQGIAQFVIERALKRWRQAPASEPRLAPEVGPDDHVLLLILHHIIVDGWSIGIFFEEVAEVYSAFAAGQHVQLPAQAFQFSDFADWQRVLLRMRGCRCQQ